MDDVYLVDTSAWIEFLRPQGSPRIRQYVASLVANDQVGTTDIIKGEILQGAKNDKDYEDLERRLGALRYYPINASMWIEVFKTGFQMRRKGFGTPITDVMIAVVALNGDATVVHADKHFDELSRVIGLKVKSYVPEVRKR